MTLAIREVGSSLRGLPSWTGLNPFETATGADRHAEPAAEPPGAGRETSAEETREGERSRVPEGAADQPATYTREGRMINVARLRSLPPERLNILI